VSDVQASVSATTETVDVTVWYARDVWSATPEREPVHLTVTALVGVRRRSARLIEVRGQLPPALRDSPRAVVREATRVALGLRYGAAVTWGSEVEEVTDA
jgi:hypothetical protein